MSLEKESEGCVLLEINSGLATIRLATESEKIAVLDEKRIESFSSALDSLKEEKGLVGLVIIGNEKGFCAGADINEIKGLDQVERAAELARRGQRIFDKLQELPFTTVAALSGACVGGGCELALACDHRVVLSDSNAKIGLPEIKLGILPGFGGTQRLPRLVGLPNALEIILQGKVVPAKKAFNMGLVDKIVGAEIASNIFSNLELAASTLAKGKCSFKRNRMSFLDKSLTFTSVGRALVKKNAKAKLLAKTKGFYPAPLKALDICLKGLEVGQTEGLEIEAKALGELAVTKESKALVHVYQLTDWASKLGRGAKEEVKDSSVGVIGAGTMGAGIASVTLGRGLTVCVVEAIEQVRAKAKEKITSYVNGRRNLSEEKKSTLLNELVVGGKISSLKDCNFVVEAIIEDLDTKKEVLTKVVDVVTDETIVATNTSSLSVTKIADSLFAPERIIGMHFFNPAEKMPLVEIIRGQKTSEKVIVQTAALATAIGKYPVVVEDVPGFLVNRILTPYLVEAAHLLSENYSERDIDRAAETFGMPMGPIRLLDEIGLDVAAKVSEIMAKSYGDRMEGPKYAEVLVKEGRLGKKNGKGFYLHSDQSHKVDSKVRDVLELSSETEKLDDLSELQDRLILSMVNEAVLCLDEGVAGQAGEDAAKQIDLATVMGIGFPPFLGGIIYYANSLTPALIKERMNILPETFVQRVGLASGIHQREGKGKGFYEEI